MLYIGIRNSQRHSTYKTFCKCKIIQTPDKQIAATKLVLYVVLEHKTLVPQISFLHSFQFYLSSFF